MLIVLLTTASATTVKAVDYLKDIKPLLRERCYACHGALKQKGGLRLDTVTTLKTGGDSGDATQHLLDRVLTTDLDERMPPEGEGSALTPAQVALLRAWISAGAPGIPGEQPEADPRAHWAYQPIKNSGKTIDALHTAHLRARKLQPQLPAPHSIYLRRLYLDLTGLPPDPAALTDPANTSAEQITDRLLASPQYGERWARHFMDIWRYCDWYGLGDQLRHSQKHLWHWRDWIIESLNADKGYDHIILQQLAADELAPEDRANLRATGYLARSYYLFNRTTWLDETIEHTSRSLLGLTMQCVKCHDHKYDPIEHADYYRLRSIFEPLHVRLDPQPGSTDLEKNGLPRVFDLHLTRPTYRHIRGDDKNEDKTRPITPGIPAVLAFASFQPQTITLPQAAAQPSTLSFVLPDQLQATLAEKGRLGQLHAHLIQSIAAAEKDPKYAQAAAIAQAAYNLEKAQIQLTQLDPKKDPKKHQAAQTALTAAQKQFTAPGSSYTPLPITLKAQEGPDEKTNATIQTYPTTSTGRRLALARWITDKRHPLTARVLVNHVWTRLTGSSFVPDVSDFGLRAPAPAQQDILDTLAAGFMDNGWSLKWLIKQIVLSDLYRRSSSNAAADPATLAADPDNTHLWRMNPRRLESQSVRDALLHLSGQLDLTLGGPSLDPGKSETIPRRSIYFIQTPDTEHRFLGAFDNANVLECYRRNESVVPQQALALTNSQLSRKTADTLAAQLGKLPPTDFIHHAFLSILNRPPTDKEQRISQTALQHLHNNHAHFIQALLNHNDFVTLR
ncbi:MAG: PSD1 domain-containing protein [Verrucomicrobiaceae bacterium]|nr:PSD1 domain-containing protein [Verrucomicrobiaceae bacterium]